MQEIKHVIICGIGAIGSIYADKISRYDNENILNRPKFLTVKNLF